jgi:HSP20 family molecular chaperone IbpA
MMAKMVTRDRDQGAALARTGRPRTLFEALFRPGFPDLSMTRDLMSALNALPENAPFIPSVELSEKDGNYVVDMALPGFSEKDIDIEVSGNEITISGKYERKQEDRKTHYSEMQQASFMRTIVLPQDVNTDKVSASFKDGMLHVSAPPVAPIAAKKVAIKGDV